MSKLRSVNTHFWDDNYIIDLDPIEKLLFLYLLTNSNTNMLGVYELHIRKISFDTGIDKDMALKIFDRFHNSGKASYIDGYVCLHNFTKHQAYNDNMKKSAVKSFNKLPESVRIQPFIKVLLNNLKPIPKGSKPIAEIEGEYEVEEESESKPEKGSRENIKKMLNDIGEPDFTKPLFALPGFSEKFLDYWVYRKEAYSHWPNEYTVKECYQELLKLSKKNNNPIRVISQTIQAGNKAFYPLKDKQFDNAQDNIGAVHGNKLRGL